MPSEGESATLLGSALNDAIQVRLDQRGRVVAVRLHPAVCKRVGPERLGHGVVLAHADARAALGGGW